MEKVQERATKILTNLKYLSYENRLKESKLPTSMHNRYRGNMLETYKILHNMYDQSE